MLKRLKNDFDQKTLSGIDSVSDLARFNLLNCLLDKLRQFAIKFLAYKKVRNETIQ
jgi:hypothetical protein